MKELSMFTRTRVINGNPYLYQEERWREAGKVRSRSKCLGRADGGGRKKRHLLGVDWDATLRSDPGAKETLAWEEQQNEAARKEREQKTTNPLPAPEKTESPAVSEAPDVLSTDSSSDGGPQ